MVDQTNVVMVDAYLINQLQQFGRATSTLGPDSKNLRKYHTMCGVFFLLFSYPNRNQVEKNSKWTRKIH